MRQGRPENEAWEIAARNSQTSIGLMNSLLKNIAVCFFLYFKLQKLQHLVERKQSKKEQLSSSDRSACPNN
jgi:hypothetical protein